VETAAEVTVGSGLRSFFTGLRKIPCTVKDVSICGLRLHTDRAIPERSGVDLLVRLPMTTGMQTFKLRGDVRWSGAGAESGLYATGIRLRDEPARFMKTWKEVIRERIRQHFSEFAPAPAVQ
jgi:hypothetical protein